MRKILSVAALVWAVPARAADELPSIHNLPCVAVCAQSTGTVPLERPLPEYPSAMVRNGIEGFILLNVTVTDKGEAGDISVAAVVGPKSMVAAAERVVRTWKWKPATLNGKPVAKNNRVQVAYRLTNFPPGARPRVVKLYSEASGLMKEKKLAEAKAILDEVESDTELNLYERGMIANASAQIAFQQRDFLEAYEASQLADEHSADVLPIEVRLGLRQTRVLASFAVGDVAGALIAFDKWKSTGFDSGGMLPNYVAETRAKADAMPVFGTTLRIPAQNRADITWLPLYRRTFAFRDVVGSLEKFRLDCWQQSIESKITDGAEWRIPTNFSGCALQIYGKPGTTFKVLQAIDPAAP